MISPPRPPADVLSRRPRIASAPAGTIVHRFYSTAFDPIHFDTGLDGRLNAPDGSYGVLYVAKAIEGAFAETFLRQPGRRQIPADLLARKGYARLRLTRRMNFILLAGQGLGVLGATAEVTHGGGSYDLPQTWSTALHRHPVVADGIAYHARHDDDETCYAVFDRSGSALAEAERTPDLDQPWFWNVADAYEVGRSPS